MNLRKKYQITEFCHQFLRDYIKEGDCCVDATCGNGNDTEFLCKMTGSGGKVYAFDIQEQAVRKTADRISAAGYSERASIFQVSHEKMGEYVKERASVIMFNFGYLPGGDHHMATEPRTSLKAVKAGMSLLRQGGVMSLCIYSGGDTGYEEKRILLEYLKGLDPGGWLVIVCDYYNRENDPPLPVFVIRLSEEDKQDV